MAGTGLDSGYVFEERRDGLGRQVISTMDYESVLLAGWR